MANARLSRLLNREYSLKTNILANFAGNGLVVVISIVAVPLYLRLIGIEAYGLVGFFAAFQAVLSVLDLGLSVTLTRELAIRTAEEGRASESRDLVRTTETIYWSIALLIGILGAVSTPFLIDFLNPENLSATTLRTCFFLMFLTLALQFPIGLYSGGLFGLQRQALVAALAVFFAAFRNLAVIALLVYVSASPEAFFGWQAIGAGLHAATIAICLWAIMPRVDISPKFNGELIRNSWRFTAGIGAISIVSVLITQVDKFVLARILSLETFGYYVLAAVVSGSLQRFVQPLFQGYFPRLTQLARSSDSHLSQTYHQGCQSVTAIVFPVSAVLIFFSREVIQVWQQNDETAANTYLILSILVTGSAINSLTFIPYGLQLAFGWTKLHFYGISAGLILSIPLTVILGRIYGPAGAAAVWVAFNVAFVLTVIPIMHRRLLPGETWKWFLNDVMIPIGAIVPAAAICRYLYVETSSITWSAIQLAASLFVVYLAAFAASGEIRERITNRLSGLFGGRSRP